MIAYASKEAADLLAGGYAYTVKDEVTEYPFGGAHLIFRHPGSESLFARAPEGSNWAVIASHGGDAGPDVSFHREEESARVMYEAIAEELEIDAERLERDCSRL